MPKFQLPTSEPSWVEKFIVVGVGIATVYLAFQQTRILSRQTLLMEEQTKAAKFDLRDKVRGQIRDVTDTVSKLQNIDYHFKERLTKDEQCKNACRSTKISQVVPYFVNEPFKDISWKQNLENYEKFASPYRAGFEIYFIQAAFRIELAKRLNTNDDPFKQMANILDEASLRCNIGNEKGIEIMNTWRELAPWIADIPRSVPNDLGAYMIYAINAYRKAISKSKFPLLKEGISITVDDLSESITLRTNYISERLNSMIVGCVKKSIKDAEYLDSLY
jgi:hypothetical protein